MLGEYVKFDSSLSERDHLAIRKTFSGMVKLLYPDGNLTHEEALKLVEFAAEGRKRVKDQLYIIDSTFKENPALFRYTILKGGDIRYVETLEKLNNNMPDAIPEEVKTEKTPDTDAPEKAVRLTEKTVSIRMGQMGVSYKSLFADYLANANVITIEDPFIRTFWQIRNLSEFLSMLVETRSVEGLKIHLKTSSEDDFKAADVIDDLTDIQDEMESLGVEFSFEFADFHDRCIKTDKGWKIILGRGLDIFESYGKFSIANSQQSRRKCKDFNVTYARY